MECQPLTSPEPGVVDDLQQGLQLLSGFLERAQQDLQAGNTREARARLRLAARMANTLWGLVATSVPDAPNATRVSIDLGKTLHEVAHLTAPIWGAHAESEGRAISVNVDAPGDLEIQAAPQRVRASLISLVVSAVNALPAGGEISLTARRAADTVAVDVCARSAEREHAATRLTFPVAQARVRPQRILVVDAAPALRRLMAIVLTRPGHLVEAVASGSEALAKLEQSPVDLVVSDLWLDGRVTGLDLAAAVRQRWPAARFIVTTVSARDLTHADRERLGIVAVLEKPFSPAALREVVAQLAQS